MTAAVPHHRIDGRADAPALVLANSLGTDLHLWDAQVPALAERFRVIRYDHRGHGGSRTPPGPSSLDDLAADVVALLDHLGVAQASFAGVSLGGMVGMTLAAGAPERVDRLVLCCTSADLPPAPWTDRAAAVRTDGMEPIADAVMARWFSPAFAASRPDTINRMRASFIAIDPEGYAGCCEAIAAMNLAPRLSRIQAPTLVLAGAGDAATPPDHAQRVAAAIPGARLVVIPDAAHLANVEQARAVTRAILRHLRDHDDGGAGEADEADGRDARADDHRRGMKVRRQVLGDAHVDASVARTTAFTADFQSFITRYAWGDIWTRPGLDRRTRSCITVAMLVALGRDEELALHLRAARTNGVTIEELEEVLLQTAVYCGAPAANHAFAVAVEVLGDEVAR